MTWKRIKQPRAQIHGSAHAQARKQWAARHDPQDPCARCGRPLGPMGPNLHLDHHDRDKTRYIGFSHAACNTRRAGQLGRAQQKARAAARRQDVIRAPATRNWYG